MRTIKYNEFVSKPIKIYNVPDSIVDGVLDSKVTYSADTLDPRDIIKEFKSGTFLGLKTYNTSFEYIVTAIDEDIPAIYGMHSDPDGVKLIVCEYNAGLTETYNIDINTGGEGGSITVDSALSSSSTNPVQNKVINRTFTTLLEDIHDVYDVLNTNGIDNKSNVAGTSTSDALNNLLGLSLMFRGVINNTNNLNTIREQGIYVYTTSLPENTPSSATYGLLIVISGTATSNLSYCYQLLITSGSKQYWRRQMGNDVNAWTAWNETVNGSVATTTANGLMSATDKANLDSVYADYSSAIDAIGR